VHDGRPGPPGPQVWDGRPEVQEPPRPQVWDVRPEVQEPPRPQVRLLEVLDLQLFQPRQSQVAREELQPHDEEIFEKEDDPRQPVVEAAKRRGVTSSPSSPRSPNGRTPAAEVQAPVRPLRGLILEVIDEMSKPPMYQEPAEVLGGSELAPLFAAPKARPKAAPVDEDTYGRRLGRAPPPYQVGPPPPYDGPNRAVVEAEEKLRKKLREKQEDLKSQEKALQVSQAEAQAQVKQLIELQKKADEQSAAVAQAQASLQAQIQSQREESQRFLDSVQQSFARSRAEEAEGRGVEGHAGVRAVPGSSDVHERLGRLEALLEGRFTETLRAMAAQSEERKAYVAALADQKSAPMQMVPLCVPQPAPPAPPPQPKVTVASQTQVEDPTKKKEHQARVARFTHYLLHGPPGAPAAEPARPVSMPEAHAEAWKALALRERLEQREDKSSVAASSSATASQAMERMPYAVRAEAASSPGEVLPRASQQRHARAPRGRSGSSLGEVTMSGRSSPGELRSNGEVTDRGDVSGSEEGELPFPLSRAVPPSTGEVSRGEQAADSLSARSSGEVSSFAA
ncbi:C2H2-type domain-containing protein, partial [Durusdinium trenchii]